MNYKKIYDELMLRSKDRVIEDNIYTEKHHIIPKSLGGSNDNDNLVVLTAREHFLAHYLLTKIIKGSSFYKMCFAFSNMCNMKNKYTMARYIPTSRQYQLARELHIKAFKKVMAGRIVSQETKDKISKAHLGKKLNYTVWNKGKKGIKTWNKGIEMPQLSGANNYLSKEIVQFDLDGNFVKEWICISDACKVYGRGIQQSLKDHQKGYNYQWRYKSDWNGESIGVYRRKYRDGQGIAVNMLDKETNEIIKTFITATEAALFIANKSNAKTRVLDVCKGKRKTAYGYKWSYYEK